MKINVFNKFQRFIFFRIDVVNFLFQINNSKIVKSRNRFFEAKNKKQMKFKIFTNRIFFQFELMKMKTIVENMIDFAIERIIQQIDSTFERRWRERRANRNRSRNRNRDKSKNENNHKKINNSEDIKKTDEMIIEEIDEMTTEKIDEMTTEGTDEVIIEEVNEVTTEKIDEITTEGVGKMITEEIGEKDEIEDAIIKAKNRRCEDLLIVVNSDRV